MTTVLCINVFKIDFSVFFSFHKHDLSSYLAVFVRQHWYDVTLSETF